MKKIFTLILISFPFSVFAASSADGMIKFCLSTVYSLQVDYQADNGVYADTIQALKWVNQDCVEEFDISFLKSSKTKYTIKIASDSSTWTINNNKEMRQIK